MDNKLSLDKVMLEHNQSSTPAPTGQEHIWKNILKIEALKKAAEIQKCQVLCKNLRIK